LNCDVRATLANPQHERRRLLASRQQLAPIGRMGGACRLIHHDGAL
jgi:hypothetical protein